MPVRAAELSRMVATMKEPDEWTKYRPRTGKLSGDVHLDQQTVARAILHSGIEGMEALRRLYEFTDPDQATPAQDIMDNLDPGQLMVRKRVLKSTDRKSAAIVIELRLKEDVESLTSTSRSHKPVDTG